MILTITFFQLRDLKKLNPDINSKLSVHFLLQNRECSESDHIDEEDLNIIECKQRHQPILTDKKKMKLMAEYPVNEARNLARNVTI